MFRRKSLGCRPTPVDPAKVASQAFRTPLQRSDNENREDGSSAPKRSKTDLGFRPTIIEPERICTQFRSPMPKLNNDDEDGGGKRKRRKLIRIERPFDTERIDVTDPMRSKLADKFSSQFITTSLSEHETILQKLLSKPFVIPIPGYNLSGRALGMGRSSMRVALFDPYGEGAVVLFTPPPMTHEEEMKMKDKKLVHVVVDPCLSKVLRPHQVEGVKFMYNCVNGRNIENYRGCIMADEMGLGKTLQCITLMWTLLRQSPDCKPTISKAIIVCPSSLVKNWDKEIHKWLGDRVHGLPVDTSTGGKDEITSTLRSFMLDTRVRAASPILIISYETFRNYSDVINSAPIGLCICDEGHRLKNNENLTYKALSGLKCDKRILISGTPIQNDLLEYYSLVNFVNPGLLGTASEFKKKYENAILKGRDGAATDADVQRGNERTKEMIGLVEKCIIRRTSTLLTKYLPVKYEHIICCRNTPLQDALYHKLIEIEKETRAFEKQKSDSGKATASALSFITLLKKLCNHPSLVYEEVQNRENKFHATTSLFKDPFNPKRLDPSLSGKMKVLDYLLAITRKKTDDRWVLISNYTQTMDQFIELCKLRGYGYVRLDGSMTPKQRQKVVEEFNKPDSGIYCFLLSSKAGGCGLNLIGANRLVMFDPDWNPANDDQAMARVWRDGQKKHCFIYRLLATGSIEEKMFQRQTHKKALSSCIVDAGEDVARHFSSDQLKELFKLESNVFSDTHDKLKCKRCIKGVESIDPPDDADCSSDLAHWFHSQATSRKIADNILRAVYDCGTISFIFHQKSHKVEAKRQEADKKDAGSAEENEGSDKKEKETSKPEKKVI
ncbi:hypothetical protein WR25_25255 isoform F [Diploscapter pachys]|uniref:DNA repair and recombination protein RAD54-like n=1 Tax=Diploscapter pachys TaxID=2018661 RepID=A0A2A2J8Y4_9BILA|nr:hypothetical protein WR25_25255 isoform B [Diploscapter pachys]PAV58083.1 hypothetical protein WR25_25255 isoform D [Diploscapter pachys]PAV58085.1 hypothetical protein WR25_25255 isoform F [Diploscapter pachys]